MTVYITKYALTQGILEVESIPVTSNHKTVLVGFDLPGLCRQYASPAHAHETKDAAIAKAEKMRLKAIDSLTKKLAELGKLTFQP
jgi:hypothetical protein